MMGPNHGTNELSNHWPFAILYDNTHSRTHTHTHTHTQTQTQTHWEMIAINISI